SWIGVWKNQIDWDSAVPMNIHTQWKQFKSQLPSINELKIGRFIFSEANAEEIQLHGFADASQSAYGACCYIRTRNIAGNYETKLLISKSRVAPMKAVSLPRLELCAAVLLARLQEKVIKSIKIPNIKKFLWTDSMIALSWIRAFSRKWEIFIANRVGEIQRLTEVEDWRHIDTKSNPADIISRGAGPSEVINLALWWEGPGWLKLDVEDWPKSSVQSNALPELLANTVVIKSESSMLDALIAKYSKIQKLVRVRQEFGSDIRQLEKSKSLPTNSRLLPLNPFLDDEHILRVGGRLKNANLAYESKHPLLLPKGHAITRLIIRNEHVRNMHAGVQATLYAVRSQFWPIAAKATTRDVINKCTVCWKAKPSVPEATMSDLPKSRVQISRPFTHCGVDFGGPFLIREHKRRNAKLSKAYICIFVCFATKAVHIELVADLSSESFMGALKRFIARRGKVACMHSDNGTNFVGAARELNELHDFFIKEQIQHKINEFFVEHRIEWRNIPPNAPHFGGLWEAAIKSAKYHMKRIIGDAALNYDEMTTVLAEIEAILNSRPISQLSNDPNDLRPLTPGHFLIGDALNSYAHPDITLTKINRLSRWQRVEQLRQHFWQRWSLEYLNQLQGRSKWRMNKGKKIKAGQVVLVQKPGLALFQWLLGRIESVNESADGIVRSAVIKTNHGLIARPLTKLSVLPTDLNT
ncbi:PREDICTED: uncharacterized protein LOC105571183, partial [Vollenhovia emeryi]|uniref:uncharacterized protein LOC105571183 n=1 Tax=Vollenhovia emeryi TaxID=411798 RepID=UPI0005F58933